MGDYAAQAVVNTILGRTFPKDPIVGEEDAADLRQESGKILRERIVQLASETLAAPLAEGEKEEWGLGPNQAQTSEQLLDAIDRGNYEGGRTGRECFVLCLHLRQVLYAHARRALGFSLPEMSSKCPIWWTSAEASSEERFGTQCRPCGRTLP